MYSYLPNDSVTEKVVSVDEATSLGKQGWKKKKKSARCFGDQLTSHCCGY
jgi:hypothetical protein